MDNGANGKTDRLDMMFRELEADVTAHFGDVETVKTWGDAIVAVDPDVTLKAAQPAEFSTVRAPVQESGGSEFVPADVSVMLSIHSDGSASMTLPGASVTLSPRRTTTVHGSGEYEIGDVLGVGGMGIVSLARQASLDRQIVIKTIRPEYAERIESQEKFITEALAIGSLDHPNVVPIHDMGVGDDGKLFYVMKQVKGRNWRQALPELSESENIDILMRVCDAVAFAHDRGIIHRDIKPENVMLGDFGEVLLMDWGLAAAILPTAKAAHITDASACAGTPSFMAPEMARGLAADLGPWSDQYLLGAVLFNILTGKPPHPGANAKEGVRNAANNLVRKTTRRDELMEVALRAMHANPRKRFPSVKEFQKAVGHCRIHLESIALSRKGDEVLDRAIAESGYDDFIRAINFYEQALVLWDGNDNAAERIREARQQYATRAIAQGDFGLALALTENSTDPVEIDLATQARRGQAQVEARRRRVRLLSFVATALLLLVAFVSATAYVIISRQAAAEREARTEAERQRGLAEERRAEAADQRNIAMAERRIAEEQRRIAESERAEADEQRQNAVEALRVAEEARAAEAVANEMRLREQTARLAAVEEARNRAEEALRARQEIQRLGYLEDNSRWRFTASEAKALQAEAAASHGIPVTMTARAGQGDFVLNLIPLGEYVMGSPPRDPSRNSDEYLHEVVISRPVYFGITEVTRGQWQAVVGVEKPEDIGADPADEGWVDMVWRFRPVPADDANLPATAVSHDDVMNLFLPALNRLAGQGGQFRLPTEAEWEWAARAGTTGHFYTGDLEEDLARCGWYVKNSGGKAQTVGQKEPNVRGLYDIIGNVWELNLDAY
ncbi:MAG: SUMF1/EgtB/PvdO family nonheme iron enzyme, partial [Planctomycetaceae bacterium]|nr:SUMF1/EgtB/PvdO family nonheme iron enzyme [Planctomycetaceae bacterium]